jgi:hemolysin activation/secretion protein
MQCIPGSLLDGCRKFDVGGQKTGLGNWKNGIQRGRNQFADLIRLNDRTGLCGPGFSKGRRDYVAAVGKGRDELRAEQSTPAMLVEFHRAPAGRSLIRCCMAVLVCLSGSAYGEPEATPANLEPADVDFLSPLTLEKRGATIGEILIDNDNIFDLSDPEENSWLYRLANRAHVKTRPTVIRQQLLFQTGDTYSHQVLEESERILRGNHYLQDAVIQPVEFDDGTVDLRVATTDTWTLSPSVSFGRTGGANTGAVGIKEQNLLGTGIKIGASYRSDVDRDSTSFVFHDSQLGNSWVGLFAAVASNSDGHTRRLDIDRPFHSLDARVAGGFSMLDDDRIDTLYDLGEPVADFRHQTRTYEAYRGWSKGLQDGGTRRFTAGVAFDDHQFSPAMGGAANLAVPSDRKYVYPFIGVEYVQDKFEKTTNHDQINRTEDRFLGTRLSAKLGFASSSFGSSEDAYLLSAQAQRGFGHSDGNSLLLESGLGLRWANSDVANLLWTTSAKYYRRQSEKRLLYVNLSGTYGSNLDVDTQVLLGGDNGLRGYPLRYQTGNKRALLSIEQRYFTDWYPFRLFHIGGAVFFDAGRTWGDSVAGAESSGLLRDVGFGLRIGNSRSGVGRMTHIDLAFPLDGDNSIRNVQFLLELKQGF